MGPAWAVVEFVGDGVQVDPVECAEVGALGEVLPNPSRSPQDGFILADEDAGVVLASW